MDIPTASRVVSVVGVQELRVKKSSPITPTTNKAEAATIKSLGCKTILLGSPELAELIASSSSFAISFSLSSISVRTWVGV